MTRLAVVFVASFAVLTMVAPAVRHKRSTAGSDAQGGLHFSNQAARAPRAPPPIELAPSGVDPRSEQGAKRASTRTARARRASTGTIPHLPVVPPTRRDSSTPFCRASRRRTGRKVSRLLASGMPISVSPDADVQHVGDGVGSGRAAGTPESVGDRLSSRVVLSELATARPLLHQRQRIARALARTLRRLSPSLRSGRRRRQPRRRYRAIIPRHRSRFRPRRAEGNLATASGFRVERRQGHVHLGCRISSRHT